MKNLTSLFIVSCISIFLLSDTQSQSITDRTNWLLPNHVKTQFAGNIGFISGGAGYEFFNGNLNSDLLLGYVPKSIANTTIFTLVQKNTIRLFHFKNEHLKRFYPLVGFSINMETGKNSFIRVPEKYADGYYKTKAFTFSFFGGIALEGNINPSSIFNQIDYYVEVGTLATYLYYSFINKDYFNPNIWSLAIGIKANLNL